MVVKLTTKPVHVNALATGCSSLAVSAKRNIEVKTVLSVNSHNADLVVNLTGKNASVYVNQVLVEEIVTVSYFLTLLFFEKDFH